MRVCVCVNEGRGSWKEEEEEAGRAEKEGEKEGDKEIKREQMRRFLFSD